MKSYSYFPGCSLKGMSSSYDISTRRVAELFDVELEELEDWNCCGATSYMSVNELMSFSISARNLVLAERVGKDLVTPCSACFSILNKTEVYLKEHEDLKAKVEKCLNAANLSYGGGVRVRHLLDIFVNDVGYEAIRSKAKKTLNGLKLAPYYGCQIVRPKNTFDHHESPTSLDELLGHLGADVIDYAYKVKCCGASLIIYDEKAALELVDKLLNCAVEKEADAIVTTCPLCHMNLDNYQTRINRIFGRNYKIPILYFTQAIGLAAGFTIKEMAIDKFITPVNGKFRRLFE
jgi:heterodisulfide reductase subunit B